MQKTKKEEGITLIALVTTIVVLLILASITIGAVSGEGGLIGNANEAKEKTEIANEKEVVDRAVVQAMGKNKRGNLVRSELQDELDKITGEGETEVTIDEVDYGYFVKFLDSGRIYKVSRDGDVEYLGKEEELLTQANIIANPESNTTPEFIQSVDLTVETPIDIGDVDFMLVSAWSQDKNTAPEDSEFQVAELTGEGRRRTTTVNSSASVGGDYYLWVRVVVGEIEKEECFGPYAIKDSTTLVATVSENTSESYFLGMPIERGLIQSVEIKNTLVGTGHSLGDGSTYDVTAGNKEKYLGWYEANENGNYDVTIAGEGGVVAYSNATNLFRNIGAGITDTNIEVTITGLEYLDTGLVTYMNDMFNSCKASSLDLSSFDTSKVKNMGTMFSNCKATSIDVSSFNTHNVTNMNNMFDNCSATSLDLFNFDTSNVTTMISMFRNCRATNIDVSNFDTSNVTAMNNMFEGCSVTNLDLSNFDINNVSNMQYMFRNCKATSINLSSFKASKITSTYYMFNGCSSLIAINLSNFDTSNVTNMGGMFQGCSSLTNINISNFNTSNVTNMNSMFQGCSKLESLNLSSFSTVNVKDMGSMFSICSNLVKLDLSNFSGNNVKNVSQMFSGCYALQELDLSNFETNKVTNMGLLFNGCRNLNKLDIRKFDMTNVTDYGNIFNIVPTACNIIVNQNMKDWMTEHFPNYTNVIISN